MKAVVSAVLCAVLVSTSACGLDDAAKDAADQVAESAKDAIAGLTVDAATARVGDAVERVLSEAGYTIDQPPDCSAALDPAGARLTGQVECSGKVTTGESYTATFVGSLTLRGNCPGTLRVEVDGDPTVSERRVDVCRLAQLLNSLG